MSEKNQNDYIHNVTLLVLSCDRYEDAWDPYFKLIKRNWSDYPAHCCLVTEDKEYCCGFMPVKTIKTGKNLEWSSRLKFALSQVVDEYVLFSLEDYFIHDKVNNVAFNDAYQLLKANSNWGGVWFHPILRNKEYPKDYVKENAYKITGKTQPNRTNMMIILYRKSYLQRLITSEENAWKFERESNIRSIVAGKEVVHYRINDSSPIFSYYNKFIDGVGITSGRWLERTHEVFEDNGITNVNFENLGIIESKVAYKDPTDKRCTEKHQLSIHEFFYYYVSRRIKNSKAGHLFKAGIYWFRWYRK